MTDISIYKGYTVLTIDPNLKYKIRITKTKAKIIVKNLDRMKKFITDTENHATDMKFLEIHNNLESHNLTYYYCKRVIEHQADLIAFLNNN
ncbi:MAG: hypothetical protein HOP31_12935 [Ignavibacteria bacterium]|nr:hypothetical protein [Ignavibacteria bacterium]